MKTNKTNDSLMVECMLMGDIFFLMKKVLGSNLTWDSRTHSLLVASTITCQTINIF
jgi:hypothetical protein